MASTEQHYSLRWNDYTVKIVTAFQALRDEEDFVDVTVACDGHHYSAHKMVLSACSPYFRSLLRANPCQHPIVILKDVGHVELERLLEFMYNGEVNIAQDQLAAFLKTAESLKIRGLAGSSEDNEQQTQKDISHSYTPCLPTPGCSVGGISGGTSPSVAFTTLAECKEDMLTSESVFVQQSDSPTAKRRKREHCLSNQVETGQLPDNLTDGSLMEAPNERDPSNGGMELHTDRRELKSEPTENLVDVYADASEMDPNQHQDGMDQRSMVYPIGSMPGPSVATISGQQETLTLGSQDSGVALGGAVCEALNLSIRQTSGIRHMNGRSSFPPSISVHQQHIERNPFQHPGGTPSNATMISIPEEELEFKVNPILTPGMPPEHYPELAMDLVCGSDKGHDPALSNSALTITASPDYKAKLYPCPECHKVFRHPMSLHHHRHVHKGTYTCQSCAKVFSRRWDLHRHIHRSKMGCRRPSPAAIPALQTPDHHYDLNPPSN